MKSPILRDFPESFETERLLIGVNPIFRTSSQVNFWFL